MLFGYVVGTFSVIGGVLGFFNYRLVINGAPLPKLDLVSTLVLVGLAGICLGLGHLLDRFLGEPKGPQATSAPSQERGEDVQYDVALTAAQAEAGYEIKIRLPHRTDELSVKVPPGIAHGARLRMRGVGKPGPKEGRPGDLYLGITIQ